MTSNSEDTLTADLKSYSNITDKLRQLTPDSDWVFTSPFLAYFLLLKADFLKNRFVSRPVIGKKVGIQTLR